MDTHALLAKEYLRLGRAAVGRDPFAYQRLRRAIAGLIEQGGLRAGYVLPGERDLAQWLKLSRATVRRAIRCLVAEGLLVQKQGSGTFVAERIEKALASLTSFADDLQSHGLPTRTAFIERSTGQATAAEREALQLAPDQPVSRIRRLRYGGGEPLAVECSTVPADVLPNPELVHGSLYEALGALGHRPLRATQHLRVMPLTGQQARQLAVPVGTVGMYVERKGFTGDGRSVEFSCSWYRGYLYNFVDDLRV
ncbi:MAG: GntR family transcriptional regulator [Rhodanobacter sp.]|nr:MAG: GntR family transcriptional regulator [Rhodanobacter sp.]TAM08103.1 MAG: GntR family transcriptional regulator [Rhodanobacter sp.]TAM37035.1 MAG: GntR family transcriptional regulator [Rhodanobacter sp.]